MRRYAMHTMMNIAKRCVLFCFFFGHLICGVNHEEENTVSLHTLLLNDLNNISASTVLAPLIDTSSDDISNSKMKDSKSQPDTSFCPPYDSCVSRCDEPPRGLPFTCNCDPDCDFYSDCCVDMKKVCGNDTNFYREPDSRDTSSLPKVTCELLVKDYPIFIVSNCSPKWKNESFKKLCDSKITTECIFANSATKAPEFDDAHENCVGFVYHQCQEEVRRKCNETVEPLCSTLIQNHCNKVTSAKCGSCTKEFWPVFDQNQVLYRNSYCAKCNFEDNYFIAESKSLVEEMFIIKLRKLSAFGLENRISRKCFISVTDLCPNDDNKLLSSLCRKTLGPVLSTSKNSHGTIYKNVYCALCRNESLNDMRCMKSPLFSSKNPIDPNMMTGMIKPLVMDFVTGVTSDIQGLRLDDIPAAFSFLLNFGLDGRERVYISSEGDKAMKEHQKRCGSGYIWDPFSSICRKLHCSTEFVLVDYQCVRKDSNEKNATDIGDINIPDAAADFVHLTLVAEMELFDFLAFYKRNISEICDSIRESFSSSFNIKIDRIKNVSFNISLGNFTSLNETLEFLKVMDEFHPINFTIDFDLYEMSSENLTQPELSVDSIVSLMASALSVNGFDLGINNSTSRVYEIHQTVDFLKSWCNPKDGGVMKRYWNSEFKLILNDNVTLPTADRIKGIYINKTGQFYPKGQFVADILYQGHQFNQNLINVSGLAVICERKAHLNESCIRIILEKNEYFLTENGSLVLNDTLRNKVIDDSIYEEAENDSIVVCLLSPVKKEVGEGYFLEMDVVQAYLSFALSWISVFATIAVLVTYSIFSSLRNLPGCNTMNLTFSLLALQLTTLFGQRNTVKGDACKGVSILLHYVILSCFMWMNIMAYDLYKTFGNKTVLNNIRSKGKYLFRYMLYAYGLPMLIVLTTALLDKYLDTDSNFSPQYGKNDFCWIANKCAAALYFATPLAVIMCVNFIFYLLTIFSIRNVKHVLYLSNQKQNQRGKSDVLLYFRMALVVGFTWAFAFAAAYSKQDRVTGQILTYLFIISNTLQGVYIFAVFVCNRRVYELYHEGIRKLFAKASDGPTGTKTFGKLGGLMNALRRTVSTETVVSTVSSSSSRSNRSVVSTVSNSSSYSTHSGLETINEVE